MTRLYRPHIPLEVRCRVVLRQLGEDEDLTLYKRSGGSLEYLLAHKLFILSAGMGCKPSDLRLDHDPPLALRAKRSPRHYVPDANDPNHLRYRPHGAQFEDSHDIKTRVRGDHGQLSDLALIRKEKRRRKEKPVRKTNWPKRKISTGGGPNYRMVLSKRPFPKRKVRK